MPVKRFLCQKYTPFETETFTTAGPTLAAAFAIVSLPKNSQRFAPSSTAPEAFFGTSDDGAGLTL